MSYISITQDKSISFTVKEVQVTVGIIGAILTSNIVPQISESNKQFVSEYFISNDSNISNLMSNKLIMKNANITTYEIDSFGVKLLEIANTEVSYSYEVAERFIEAKDNTISVPKEEMSMYEKLLAHRKNTENYAFVAGCILGLSTMLVPIVSNVQFLATIPATLLFFSVPLTVLYRRKLYKEDYVE